MLVTEALERSMAAVILSAAVRRDGEPDRGRGFAELMSKVAVWLAAGWGGEDREGERVPGDDKGGRGGISGKGVAAA